MIPVPTLEKLDKKLETDSKEFNKAIKSDDKNEIKEELEDMIESAETMKKSLKNKIDDDQDKLSDILDDTSNLKKKVKKIDFYKKNKNKKNKVQELFNDCENKIKNITDDKKKQELQSELSVQKTLFSGVINSLKEMKQVELDILLMRKNIFELNKDIISAKKEYDSIADDAYEDYMKAFNLLENNFEILENKNKFGKSEITASVNSVKEINDSQEELDESFEIARKNLKYFKSERNNLQRKWTLLVKEQNKLAKNIDFLCEQITNELEEINKKI